MKNGGYRSPTQDPRELRSRAANKKAALMLFGGIVIVIVAIAVFG